MARVFAGELMHVEREVVERLREELPDDFTVLAEVNVGRNVDLVIIRPNGDEPAVLIAAELKRVSRPLMGQTDGFWKELADNGDWIDVEPSNGGRDVNHYWQAVHAANALKDWLWLNQRLYRDDADPIEDAMFGCWPDLVLMSDRELVHRLPIAPANRFGRWFFDVDTWVAHLLAWNPRKGIPLNQDEVGRLIDALGLVEVSSPQPLVMARGSHEATTLLSVVRDLKERVLALELMVAPGGGVAA